MRGGAAGRGKAKGLERTGPARRAFRPPGANPDAAAFRLRVLGIPPDQVPPRADASAPQRPQGPAA